MPVEAQSSRRVAAKLLYRLAPNAESSNRSSLRANANGFIFSSDAHVLLGKDAMALSCSPSDHDDNDDDDDDDDKR